MAGKAKKKKAARAKPSAAKEVLKAAAAGKLQPMLPNSVPEKDVIWHAKNVAHFERKSKKASKQLSDAKKLAREANVHLGAIAKAKEFENSDVLDVKDQLEQLMILMKDKGIGVQFQLFDLKNKDPEGQAKVEGYADGLAARSPNTARWPEDSDYHAVYMAAWMDGQKELALKNKREGAGKPDRGDGKEFDAAAPKDDEEADEE